MTNYEKYKENLTKDTFIESMILNCDGCPVSDCPYRCHIAMGEDCEEQLTLWCDENTLDD